MKQRLATRMNSHDRRETLVLPSLPEVLSRICSAGVLFRLSPVVFAAAISASGCSQGSEGTPSVASSNALTVGTGSGLSLEAARFYRPSAWQNDERTLAQPIEFTIPQAFQVVAGSAGNHRAKLRYRLAGGPLVTCDYRGGSDQSHPVGPWQKSQGQFYRFDACDNGASPSGAPVSADYVKLSIATGDNRAPTKQNAVTRIQVSLKKGFSLNATADLQVEPFGIQTALPADFNVAAPPRFVTSKTASVPNPSVVASPPNPAVLPTLAVDPAQGVSP